MSLEKELNLMVRKFGPGLQLLRWRRIVLCGVGTFPQIRGSATESIDGASPVIMLRIGNTLPWYMRSIPISHSEILQGDFIEQAPHLQYAHMQVLLPTDDQSNDLVFLYKYPFYTIPTACI
jgi:hypothetical protein